MPSPLWSQSPSQLPYTLSSMKQEHLAYLPVILQLKCTMSWSKILLRFLGVVFFLSRKYLISPSREWVPHALLLFVQLITASTHSFIQSCIHSTDIWWATTTCQKRCGTPELQASVPNLKQRGLVGKQTGIYVLTSRVNCVLMNKPWEMWKSIRKTPKLEPSPWIREGRECMHVKGRSWAKA